MTATHPRPAVDAPATYTTAAWSCQVRLVVGDQSCLAEAAAQLDVLLATVDRAASRFREDSDLSRANRNAGRPTAVSRTLVDLVGVALDAARRSEGCVDPCVGRSVAALGYDRDVALVPADGPAVAALAPCATWRDVRLDERAGLLTVPAGTWLDLGATAKARTADRAAALLHQRFNTWTLVELGGDLAVSGDRPGGWPVTVAEAAGGPGQVVVLTGGGMTTSTTTVRQWRRGGDTVSHLVDPATGETVRGPWRTASVVAGSALAANTASTAALVMGDRAPAWLSANAFAARLVGVDGTTTTIGGWPADERIAS